jgi:DNA invertase Pin-like site-specific DNA recombinase
LWCAVYDNTTTAWSGSSFCRSNQKKTIQEVYMNRRRRYQPGTLKRAAIYARSTKLRPLRETGALQDQVDQSATFCLEHGYLVPPNQRLASVQAGRAESDRPALARLLEAIRQGSVAVVVRSLDRLAREDPAQSAILIEEFRATGVSITITAS